MAEIGSSVSISTVMVIMEIMPFFFFFLPYNNPPFFSFSLVDDRLADLPLAPSPSYSC